MKKKITFFILLFIFVLCRPDSAFAEENTVINACVSDNDSILIDKVLRTAMERIGYQVNITSVRVLTGIISVNEGQHDLIALQMEGLEIQYPNMVMVPEKISEVNFYVYAKKEKELQINSWEDLAGLRIGLEYQGTYSKKSLNSLSGVEILEYGSKAKVMDALSEGSIDAAVIAIVFGNTVYHQSEIELKGITESKDLFTYVNKKHASIIPALSAEYKKMKESGELQKIKQEIDPARDTKKHVLHIMSYSAEVPAERDLNFGIREALEGFENTVLFSINLNSNLRENHETRNKMYGDMLRADFSSGPPDVIVISGIYALDFMKEYYHRLFDGIPVIIVGLDGTEYFGFGNNAVYLEKNISVVETVNEMLRFFPETKEIYVVNDCLKDGRAWETTMKEQLKQFENRVSVRYSGEISLEELLEELRNLPKDTVILNGNYYGEVSQRYYTNKEIQSLFEEVYQNPVFSCNVTGLGQGELGGKYIDKKAIGAYIGEIAILIADGTAIDKITLDYSKMQNQWYFDYQLMKKWGIEKSDIPEGAVILNNELSFKEKNPLAFYLAVALTATGILIIAVLSVLVYQAKKGNKKLLEVQKNLVEAEEVIHKDKIINKVKEKLETIIESAPLAYVIIDDKGKIEEMNTYASDTMNFQAGEYIIDYFVDQEESAHIMSKLKNVDESESNIVRCQTRNGGIERFYLNITAFHEEGNNRYIVWGTNVEELQKQRDANQRVQRDLKQIVDSLPWPMCIVNPFDISIKYANDAFKECFHVKEEKSFDIQDFTTEYQQDGQLSINYIKQFITAIQNSEETMSSEIVHLLPGDEQVLMSVIGSPIIYNGEASISIILQDISAQRKQEKILKSAAEKEREANQLKNNFIMNMSHEIRTPMNAIIGISDIEMTKEHPREVYESFHKVNVSARLLLTIVNDVLDFSKMESGKLYIEEEEFGLEDAIAGTLLTTSQRLADKRVEMLLKVEKEVPAKVIGDRTRVWQVIKNILDNSAKFTDEGNIILHISLKEDTGNRKVLCFQISDTGRGMSEENLKKLFVPFEQFGDSASKAAGTGLGMSITAQLIELMGGSIEVESKPACGTTTTILLPFKPSKESLLHMTEGDKAALVGKRILVVDDDATACEIMDELLHNAGAETVIVKEAEEVLSVLLKCRDENIIFDVILLDYLLDKGTGVDIAKELIRCSIGNAKLLMVSAYARFCIDNILKENIFADIIDKPFMPSEFIGKICTAVEGKRYHRKKKIRRYHFPKARVLVCEDNIINQDVIRGMLGLYDIVPVIAGNGKEGIEWMEAQEFDLVIMDILMPVMDGHTATETIRASGKQYKDTPIIAMTANAMKEEMLKCMEEGMNGYVSKPVEMEKLYRELMKWLPKEEIAVSVQKGKVSKPESETDKLQKMGIQVTEAVNRFAGNYNRYKSTLVKFSKDITDNGMKDFDQMTEEENLEEFQRYIHTLKGVTGNLSILNVHKLLIEFEAGLKNRIGSHTFVEQPTAERERYDEICSLLTGIAAEVLKLETTKEESVLETGSRKEMHDLLDELVLVLEVGKAKEGEEILTALKGKKWEILTMQDLQRISAAVDNYDYDSAISFIKSLKEKNLDNA